MTHTRMRTRAARPALPLLLALAPAGAQAGPPGTWTPLTGAGASPSAPWPLRAGDGSLLVAAAVPDAGGESLLAWTVTPAGAVANGTPIVTGWAGLSAPALVADPGGVRAFFGGQHSTDTFDP